MKDLRDYIRDIHDFPKQGIIFKDITPLLKEQKAFARVLDIFHERYKDSKIKYVVGIESRGFIIGSALAAKLGVGFIPIRKKGKLPYKTISESYQLEYGTDSIEMHEDAIEKGDRVLLVDDVLATGGTMLAAAKMLKNAELIDIAVLIELTFLEGRKKIEGYPLFSLISY